MALFYSTVPERHDTVTGSQHAEYQDPETEVDKWNSVTIHFIIYTRAFPTVTCQTVSCQTYTCSDRNVFFTLCVVLYVYHQQGSRNVLLSIQERGRSWQAGGKLTSRGKLLYVLLAARCHCFTSVSCFPLPLSLNFSYCYLSQCTLCPLNKSRLNHQYFLFQIVLSSNV